MSLFSFNSLVFGILICLCMSSCLLLFVSLAKVLSIRLTRIGIFGTPTLVKRRKNGIDYVLGWLPYTVYVGPLGAGKDDYETMPEEERAYALYGKPRSIRALFASVAPLLWLLIMLICCAIMGASGSGFISAVSETVQFELLGLRAVFGNVYKVVFARYAMDVLAGKNVVVFALAAFSLFAFISNIIFLVMQSTSETKNKLFRFLGYAVTLVVCFTFVKIVIFTWSFFSFGSNMAHILSYLAGMYVAGIVLYLLIVAAVGAKRSA